VHRRRRGDGAGGRTALIEALLPGPAQAAVFAGAVFVLNATPGVDFLLTVSRTLQGGARAGAAAALGISAGCVVHALAAASGLAALLALHPQGLRAVQWAGAGYLVWLGLGLWRSAWRAAPPRPAAPGAAMPVRSAWADFRAGVLTNVLNPKVAFFFLAFLPQFVPAGSPGKTASFLLLGAWFVVQGTLFLLALVLLTARLGSLAGRASQGPRLRRWLQGLGGGLFVALALRVMREQPTGP
jgi:threonine/homoserine/homoserine lactone efflux protein